MNFSEMQEETVFVPRDTVIASIHCPHYNGPSGAHVVPPCSTCPPTRCWFQEAAGMRKAGIPCPTPRAWRLNILEQGGFEPNPEDEDDGTGGVFIVE